MIVSPFFSSSFINSFLFTNKESELKYLSKSGLNMHMFLSFDLYIPKLSVSCMLNNFLMAKFGL